MLLLTLLLSSPLSFFPDTISVISDWSYCSGFVSGEMMSTHLPPPGPTSQILMCGPPPMIKFACLPNLEKLGFSECPLLRQRAVFCIIIMPFSGSYN